MCLQTAEWFTKFGILRIHWVLEAMEGKSICDALGNLPKNAIIDAIQKGEYIFAGSREFVLFLAAKSPKPSVCKAKKDGWWAVDRIFYGFFEHAKFTKLVVPTADGFHGSHDMHMIAGTCRDANEATKNGRLEARRRMQAIAQRSCSAVQWYNACGRNALRYTATASSKREASGVYMVSCSASAADDLPRRLHVPLKSYL